MVTIILLEPQSSTIKYFPIFKFKILRPCCLFTRTELPTEWDDQHRSSGLDGQDLQYPGTEGGVQSIRTPVKVATPAKNRFTSLESNACGWTLGDLDRPRTHLNGISTRNLADQSIGPRINRPRGQLTSSITSGAYPTREAYGNSDGSSIVHVDQYNRDISKEWYMRMLDQSEKGLSHLLKKMM